MQEREFKAMKSADQILAFLAVMQDGCERGLFEVLPDHIDLVKSAISFIENRRYATQEEMTSGDLLKEAIYLLEDKKEEFEGDDIAEAFFLKVGIVGERHDG